MEDSIKRIKETLSGYFRDKREVKAVYLYGSVLSGKGGKDSDIDIALLTEPYEDQTQSTKARLRYQQELSRLLRGNVDLVFLQEAGELLTYQIFKDGEVVVENDRETHRSFRAYRLIECLDFRFLEERMQKGMIAAMRREAIG